MPKNKIAYTPRDLFQLNLLDTIRYNLIMGLFHLLKIWKYPWKSA